MGNETSSVKIHSLLTAEDLKKLRENFPGGGASVTPVTALDWGAWQQAWPQNRRLNLEKCLKNGGEDLTFHAYQEMAGRFVRGTTEERAKLIFKLVDNKNAQTIKVHNLITYVFPCQSIYLFLMHDLSFRARRLKLCMWPLHNNSFKSL